MGVFNDSGKYPLIVSKIMLSYLCLWPLNKSVIIKLISYFILMNIILMGTTHVYYFLINITDMAIMANICTTVSTTSQTTAKIVILLYHSKELGEILTEIFDHFWDANIAGPETEASIKRGSRLIIGMVCVYLSSAFMSCWDFVAIHLVFGRRILPLESSFPFQWDKSPIFELLYVWQFIIDIYTVIHVIAAHDFFFNSLITSCISQFKLIGAVLATLSTESKLNKIKQLKINMNYDENTSDTNTFWNIYGLDENKIVAKCVEHHNRVLNICDRLQNIFGVMILLQFFLSATALCVSSFVLTQFEDYKSKMLSFSAAHLMQFFFLCTVGNELIYQSTKVADTAYSSEWYNNRDLNVQKSLVLIIQRAQREQKISALGFANLDYPNFVNVLRLSFSFYTLLGSLKE